MHRTMSTYKKVCQSVQYKTTLSPVLANNKAVN